MTTYPHPACMEPDGGEGPCRGYRALMDERDTLSQENERLRAKITKADYLLTQGAPTLALEALQ